MKKITFLFSLLLTFLGVSSAYADAGDVITDLSQLSSKKIYTISGKRGTLKQGETSLVGTGNSTADATDATQQFVVLSNNGEYFLFAYGKDQFVNASQKAGAYGNMQAFTISDNAHELTKNTYPWRFTFDNGNMMNFNNLGTAVVIDGWKNQDGGNAFQFTEVSDLNDDAKAAALDFALAKYNAGKIYSSTQQAGYQAGLPFAGKQEDLDAFNNVYNTYADKTYSTIGEEAATATAALNAAMTKLTSGIEGITDGMQVILGNKLHTTRFVYAKEKATVACLGSGTAKDSYRYLFTFKAAGDGKFKIYSNYYDKYVGSVPGGNNQEFQLVDAERAQAYTVEASAKFFGYGNIYDKNTTATSDGVIVNALHMVDWDGVVRWDISAPASAFKFIPVTSEITNAWDAAIIKLASNTNNYIGCYKSNEKVKAAVAALQTANAETKASAYRALEEALTEAGILQPVAGKYYTIQCVRGKHNQHYLTEGYGMTEETDSKNSLLASDLSTNIMPALWQFEQLTEEGKTDRYYIKAANSSSYLSKTNGTGYRLRLLEAESADKGEYVLNTASNIVNVNYAVALNDKVSNGMVSCRNENNQVVAWNGGNDGSSNNFLVKEVTEIPVAISAARYATLNLPCAVTIPTGVKAYTATDGETEITLSEIEGGVIPAKTPVILVGEAGSYNFTINTDNTAEAISTAMSGTLVPVTVAADASAYILKNGAQGIGMYKITSETDRTIAANKAYMGSTTAASSSNMKVFNFGGISTGINNAVAGNAKNNVYYDLNGRRVLYPAHGVFVKANGEKVYIK